MKKNLLFYNGVIGLIVICLVHLTMYHLIKSNIHSQIDRELYIANAALKRNITYKGINLGKSFERKDRGYIPLTIGFTIVNEELIPEYIDNFDLSFYKANLKDFKTNIRNKNFKFSVGKYRFYISTHKFFGDTFYIILSKDTTLMDNIRQIIFYSFVFLILIIAVLYLILANKVINVILKAIREITDFTNNIQKNKLKLRINKKYGNKDIDELVGTLNNMLDRIETIFRRIEDFSSNVSHELRTPITSMKSMLEVELMAHENLKDEEHSRDILLTLLEDVNWMNSIIQDLLLMTRGSKQSFVMEEVSMKKVIEEIYDLVEIMAIDNNIKIHTDLEEYNLKCDKNKIKRMLINLVSNAIKYNKENGEIFISSSLDDSYAKIVIRDTGIGIKEENLKKITEKFFREDKVRTSKKSGTGLGLSIVKFIVRQHNGTLNIESTEGKGSSFKILIPLSVED